MFRRSLFYFALLGGAAGIPYVATEYKKIGQMFSVPATTPSDAAASGTIASSSGGDLKSAMPTPVAPLAPPSLNNTMTPIAQAPVTVDLGEALRFEVSAAWILGHWPRVTACLPDEGLQGYRVPLVSGTMEDDLAGSLTYYFNSHQRCQRITLQASTGDARKIVALVTKRFGFVPQTSSEPGLYLYQLRWNGQAVSELHIRPAHIIRATEPNGRFDVLLALNNPGAK